jgi:hypothetical protein
MAMINLKTEGQPQLPLRTSVLRLIVLTVAKTILLKSGMRWL